MLSALNCFLVLVLVLVINVVVIGVYTRPNSKSNVKNIEIGELYVLGLSSSYSKNHTFIRTSIYDTAQILESNKAVVIYDKGPCYWVAQGVLVYGRTGGEYVWCQSVIAQLIELGREVYITNSPQIAKTLTHTSHQKGKGTILFSHWGWQDITEESSIFNDNTMRLPQVEVGRDC